MNKGEIWLVELPSTNGHKQAGMRPVTVLATTEANVVITVPFTSNLQALRFPHTQEINPSKKNGLSIISILLLFQIRAIDKKRLRKKIGILEEEGLVEAEKMLKKMLDVK